MTIKTNSTTPFDFDGLTIRDLTAGLAGHGSLAHIHVAPGARHRRAWSRECDKYYYVLSGQLAFTLEDAKHVLETGDLCIVPAGLKFSYENRSGVPVELLLFHAPAFNMDAEVFEE
jgi:mannose-6-phosphate isomerase-like protein (cupin superfamily)